MRKLSLNARAAILSLLLLALFLSAWQLAVGGFRPVASMDPEYAALMSQTVTHGASVMPGPMQIGRRLAQLVSHPLYDHGPNDKGIGIQLGWSLLRVLLGYGLDV
jgi:nitrate/nitrite transport system permease protein